MKMLKNKRCKLIEKLEVENEKGYYVPNDLCGFTSTHCENYVLGSVYERIRAYVDRAGFFDGYICRRGLQRRRDAAA